MIDFIKYEINNFIDLLKEIKSDPKLFCKGLLPAKRVGSCKQCGQCCRNIRFKITSDFVKTEEQFKKMQEFDPKLQCFYISGVDDEEALLFTCKAINEDGKCTSYRFRSLYCWSYPFALNRFVIKGGQTKDECGYKFKVR